MSDAAIPVQHAASLFDRPMPPGYRDELRALEAESAAGPAHRGGTILLFQLGELRLALPTRVASAVAPVLHIARIPHRSGTVLLGVVAFRGEILPCCALSRILDLPATVEQTATAGRTLILEESAGRRWAVPIDGVLGVRPGAADYTHLPAPIAELPIAEQWIRGSVVEESGIFHLLDHEVLFRQITLATA
jgi:chemotaxis-related protein WspD